MTTREPAHRPPGDPKTLWRATLETGSKLLQTTATLAGFDIYVAGLHCARDHPDMQMEAHHFCRQVNSDFIQCAIFDGNTRDANLIGIEYIVSETLFETLPADEKKLWHPHNYEVLSGQLTAPGLPETAEHELMRLLVNSYGKTWHTWHTGRHDGGGRPPDPLPMGEAMLMWSFSRDGEADEALHRSFLSGNGIDEMRQRERRRDLAAGAHPQRGVNTLCDAFPDGVGRPEGVHGTDDDRS